ncbi:hypothetical protein [Microbacterium sp. 18062]|uniref:hypothetical protein n=1 Tax=Microbacterium sp. 18062 TaxID=2681410 RepID=UPI00135B2556|nr:hypothetical protein [Microbacterium sp. 18062]
MRRRSVHSPRRTFAAVVAVLGLAAGLLVGGAAPASAADPVDAFVAGTVTDGSASTAALAESSVANDIVKAADLSKFDPTNIISDALFYDGAAMSAAEIQSFLDQKIGACQNGKCLNVLNASISSRDARSSSSTGALICSAIQGGTMRVSELIYRLQVACGISAKVILVTLQKEQGLTTSKAPSDWNLNAAMGQACPDTAPCDPAFKGVGPQLVGGVTQLKTYKAAKFGKQPGVNYIQYNPNASCGGTNLNIQNWATASLYTYTPYQPNAAALRAGYGLGDGCSSYGNRNFYQYYVDWFGSTQIRSSLIYSVGPDIYFVSGGVRFHITADEWYYYRAAFGSPVAVPSSHLEGFTDGGSATRFLRNPATGVVAYLDDGATHRFSSCSVVSQWGGSCNVTTAVAANDFDRISVGPEMTSFARVQRGGTVHQMAAGVLTPLFDGAAAAFYNGGVEPYAAVLMPVAIAQWRIADRTLFEPGRFIVNPRDGRVIVPTADGRTYHLPVWSFATELGIPTRATVVTDGALKGYSDAGTLTPFVTCNGVTYVAASGMLHPTNATDGFAAAALDDATCGRLTRSDAAAAPVFLRQSNGDIYHATAGVLRHVATMEQLYSLAQTSSPRLLNVTAATIAALPVGVPYGTPGELVKSGRSANVYLLDGDNLIYVGSFTDVVTLGLGTSVRTVPFFELPASPDVLGRYVTCSGTTYVASSGVLVRSPSDAGRAIALSETLCGRLAFQP